MIPLIYEYFGFKEFRYIIKNYRNVSKYLILLEYYLFGTMSGSCEPMFGLYINYKNMMLNCILK